MNITPAHVYYNVEFHKDSSRVLDI